MVQRFDRVDVVVATRNSAGAIIDEPILTRTGVFSYRNPDGTTRREYRPPEVVFAPESLAAYEGLPVTNGHNGKAHASNVQSVLLGSVTSPGRQDGNDLRAKIVIHATGPVDREDKKELSVGYDVEIDETPGTTPGGERYDVKQTKILPNHLAIVKKGRAGNARLNLDAADAADTSEEEPTIMPKLRLDNGIEYDAAPEVIHAHTELTRKLAEANSAKDKAEARADAAEAESKKAKENEKHIREDAVKQVKGRLTLEAAAAKVGVKFAEDESDRQIRENVVKKLRNDGVDLKDKTDGYVEAAFDMAVASFDQGKANSGSQRATVNGAGSGGAGNTARNDGGDGSGQKKAGSSEDARKAMINGMRNDSQK